MQNSPCRKLLYKSGLGQMLKKAVQGGKCWPLLTEGGGGGPGTPDFGWRNMWTAPNRSFVAPLVCLYYFLFVRLFGALFLRAKSTGTPSDRFDKAWVTFLHLPLGFIVAFPKVINEVWPKLILTEWCKPMDSYVKWCYASGNIRLEMDMDNKDMATVDETCALMI